MREVDATDKTASLSKDVAMIEFNELQSRSNCAKDRARKRREQTIRGMRHCDPPLLVGGSAVASLSH